jgi:glycine/D-amino acid oxidase-like deaminating enzyme/nitrite reductase/ring-hydroxylating ferredoxin subunit
MEAAHNPVEEKNTSGSHKTFWLESSPQPEYQPLKENLQTDVVIVGGGLGGVSVAYCLAKAGKKIVLVEDGLIGSGESGRTTAHLVSALDDRFYDLEYIYGEEDTKLIAASHKAAVDFVEETIRQEKIECHFDRLDGYLFLHPSDKPESIKEECGAAKRAGMDVTEVHTVPGLTNYNGPALKFSNQAQFHPLLYIKGLCDAIVRMGGKIFTGTHAKDINHTGITSADGFTVTADHVVVATNTPVNNTVAMHLKQTAHRTYVIAGLVKKYALPRALWWDTGDHKDDKSHPPYHYVRLHPYNDQYDLLISGGEDHPTGDIYENDIPEEMRYQKLETWTRNQFPLENILFRWSGQVLEPVDSLGFIGRNPWDKDNVYIITGDSGTGMTHCTIGGMLISDLILGKKNPWEDIYNPSRITFKTGDVFFKDLIRGVMGLLKGTPNDEKVKELAEIRAGEGKVINLSGNKCGAYRDETGAFHIVSARCTHLRAPLNWNADEKTWDCPWHGSRFTCDGEVINGPANSNLPVFQESDYTDQDK